MTSLPPENGTPRPAPGTGRGLVVVRNAVKRFGATVALNDMSFSVREGESHGLVGRNGAGKSTLVSVLTGLRALDSGSLEFAGEPAPPLTDRPAWQERVACVYQHRTLVPHMSVAENLYLNVYDRKPIINWKTVNKRAAKELEQWEIPVSPTRRVSELGVGEAQMIEIVRALAQGSRFVILDEPTAQLVASEIDHLIERVNQLRDRGVTFLFISHHLDEVPQVCDRVTILRNGTDVAHGPATMSTQEMVSAMVGEDSAGRELTKKSNHRGRTHDPAAKAVLKVENLDFKGLADRFNLELRAGEVVGLAGHAGSGTREIAHAITGHFNSWTGTMEVQGKSVAKRWDSYSALRAGVSLVPEDRIKEGLVGGLSIEDNATMTVLRNLTTRGLLLDLRARRRSAEATREDLGVACSSVRQPVGQLSGGNQQKVLLGAALAPRPAVLVLMHPTAGVDIASKATIFQSVEKYREQGLAVVLVSDEPEELEFCDRIQVWVRGHLAVEGTDIREDELVAAMEGSTLSTGELS
jgi:simple sugar transport system ATP-binding protein